jgi:hypothetical protein
MMWDQLEGDISSHYMSIVLAFVISRTSVIAIIIIPVGIARPCYCCCYGHILIIFNASHLVVKKTHRIFKKHYSLTVSPQIFTHPNTTPPVLFSFSHLSILSHYPPSHQITSNIQCHQTVQVALFQAFCMGVRSRLG